ncbi:hypothetical protein ANN_00239 [Periplaneta americana]|uniref:Uncharacterized protein n=1 Tax=Periplaneta americana TaxID=6978 RepID=A0ABQ8TSK8_PERAM|nr:hypothetical protein ANN_00239 [Periplaneta americana]
MCSHVKCPFFIIPIRWYHHRPGFLTRESGNPYDDVWQWSSEHCTLGLASLTRRSLAFVAADGMAKPHPCHQLQQRVKVLEDQMEPLLKEVLILRDRMDAQYKLPMEAGKMQEEEKTFHECEELRKMKDVEHKLRLELEAEKEKVRKLREEVHAEHQLRLQKESPVKGLDRPTSQLLASRPHAEAEVDDHPTRMEEAEQRHHKALERVRAAAVELLRDVGVNLQATDNFGRTLLHQAAKQGDTDMVQLLLDAGSSVNAADHDHYTALYLAAAQGHRDACRALLAAGAQQDRKIRSGLTALHVAARGGHAGVCELLLSARAELSALNDLHWTPLHYAAESGRASVVQLLLQHGADHRAKDLLGRTPSDVAHSRRHTEVATMLEL